MEITTIFCILGWAILILGWILWVAKWYKQTNSLIVIASEINALSKWAAVCFFVALAIFAANLVLLSFLA